jgi:hypothetical protein
MSFCDRCRDLYTYRAGAPHETLEREREVTRDHVLASEALPQLGRQRLAGEYINDRECSKARPVCQLISHEIQAPDIVGSAGDWLDAKRVLSTSVPLLTLRYE